MGRKAKGGIVLTPGTLADMDDGEEGRVAVRIVRRLHPRRHFRRARRHGSGATHLVTVTALKHERYRRGEQLFAPAASLKPKRKRGRHRG